jgi:hypothetical protein
LLRCSKPKAEKSGPIRPPIADCAVDGLLFPFDGGWQIRYERPVEIILSGTLWCKANLRLLTFFAAAADSH